MPDGELVPFQFNRLIRQLLNGSIKRNRFLPWEMELLLDIEACNLPEARWELTLRQYQRGVQRHLAEGAALPMKLSEYLAVKRPRGRPRAMPEPGPVTGVSEVRDCGSHRADPQASPDTGARQVPFSIRRVR